MMLMQGTHKVYKPLLAEGLRRFVPLVALCYLDQ